MNGETPKGMAVRALATSMAAVAAPPDVRETFQEIEGQIDRLIVRQVRELNNRIEYATGNGNIREFWEIRRLVDNLQTLTQIRNAVSVGRDKIDRKEQMARRK